MRAILVGFVILSGFARSAPAGKLSDQLKAEGAAAIAAAARQSGDAVRGAILFPAKNIACAQCHVSGGRDAVGPDLTQLPADRTDVQLVESLLEPSKAITKGYDQMLVATTSGQVLSGRLVAETNHQVVLRSGENPQQLIVLRREDIEQSRLLETSAMPDGIVDQFENRQQLLDVVRYLMTLRDSNKNRAVADRDSPTREPNTLPTTLYGLTLLDHYQCDACHQNDLVTLPFPARRAPNLTSAAVRLRHDFIAAFIADPAAVRPGTSMPNVLHQVEPGKRQAVANALAAFIQQLGKGQPPPALEDTADDRELVSAARGARLYHEVGCVACHSPRDSDGHEPLAGASIPLGDLRRKYQLAALVEFLKSPETVRPHGRMPNLKLTHWEALAIARFLMGDESATETTLPKPDSDNIELGRQYFTELGCGQCHVDTKANWTRKIPSLSKVDVRQGCLSDDQGSWPRFGMTAQERMAIVAAIQDSPAPLSPDDAIDVTLDSLRCTNCHERDGRGGPGLDRANFFQTTDLNLGPQGHIPPLLTNVGAKLQRQWLREVIVMGEKVRPYMKTRMPAFPAEHVGTLVELLAQRDHLPTAEYGAVTDEKAMREAGQRLAGSDGLNCVACHTFQELSSGTMQAIDLTVMARRLKKDWFYHYMQSPQSMSPATVMPSFWPGGTAIRTDILAGDRKQQLEALWVWLKDGRQARRPRGVTHERIELLAKDEAVMLRRSYPGVGKRGIGVGYPAGVNIVFDAEQMRLATMWPGRFADPSGVWYSQGHGMVRPLERNPLQFAKGPDLDDAEHPWEPRGVERPPHRRFLGYDLDDKRRPLFRYRYLDIDVEDYGTDVASDEGRGVTWRRLIRLTSASPHDGLRFRLASGRSIERQPDGAFVVDHRLLVRVVEGSPAAQVVSRDDTYELRLPLQIKEGTKTWIVEYQWTHQ